MSSASATATFNLVPASLIIAETFCYQPTYLLFPQSEDEIESKFKFWLSWKHVQIIALKENVLNEFFWHDLAPTEDDIINKLQHMLCYAGMNHSDWLEIVMWPESPHQSGLFFVMDQMDPRFTISCFRSAQIILNVDTGLERYLNLRAVVSSNRKTCVVLMSQISVIKGRTIEYILAFWRPPPLKKLANHSSRKVIFSRATFLNFSLSFSLRD